jgi:CubicO group peptidase (beta-lactamase class C family)
MKFTGLFAAPLALAVSFSLSACASPAPKPAPPSLAISGEINELVEVAMSELGVVPGFSVAVYTPEGVYARGFGVTDVETGDPVSEETAFYIASSTKSFVALTMNILHHRGEIDLDATLNEYAPDAEFPYSIAPDEVILRELLTHTSGVSNGPIGFRAAFTGQHTPELNWRLLSTSEPNEDAPHGTFDYTNEGYNVLTVMTDRKLGVDWQDLVAQEIIEPVGMTRTTAYMSKANSEGWSLARPHYTGAEGGPVRVALEKTDETMQSAGGMVMSANDALRWLELLVEDGAVGGEQIIPAEAVRETRAPLAEFGGAFGDYKRDHYGLGWYTGPYKDDMLVHHFGGFAGFRAHVSYMPDRKVGVAAFVNDSETGFTLPDIVANFIYDRLAGDPDARAAADVAVEELVTARDQAFKNAAADRERRAAREWKLSLPREKYVGVYENGLYGAIEVTLEGEDLVLSIGNLRSVTEPFTAPESIRHELIPYSGDVMMFVLNDSGEVEALMDRRNIRYDRR